MERELKSNGPPQHTTFTETLSLIRAVKKRPVLWDRSHHLHNDRRIKDALWEEIASYLGKSELLLQSRWKDLCDRFRKELLESPLGLNGSDPALFKVQWPYFKHMFFLKDKIKYSVSDPEDTNQTNGLIIQREAVDSGKIARTDELQADPDAELLAPLLPLIKRIPAEKKIEFMEALSRLLNNFIEMAPPLVTTRNI